MSEKRLLAKVLSRLGFATYAMSQRQGFYKGFLFYILDSEEPSHYPHVHICVSKSDKQYKGKNLEDGNKYQTIVSLKLRTKADYSLSNLEFEKVYDQKAITTKNKKTWINFLNGINEDSGNFNNWHCWFDFKRSNPNNLFIKDFNQVQRV